jgi:hypothetical protein
MHRAYRTPSYLRGARQEKSAVKLCFRTIIFFRINRPIKVIFHYFILSKNRSKTRVADSRVGARVSRRQVENMPRTCTRRRTSF